MFNFGPTFIWTMVNLYVLYLVLKKVLFKPVMEYMDNRAMSIKNKIDSADSILKQAEEDRVRYAEQLEHAERDGALLLEATRNKAEEEAKNIIDETRKHAEKIILEAKKQIEQERIQMLKDVRNQVVNLAISAASKIMEANLNNETNKQVVQRFLDEEGVA